MSDKHIYSVIGTGFMRKMITYYVEADTVWCGDFSGTLEQFSEQMEKTYKDNAQWLAEYRAAILFFETMKNALVAACAQDDEDDENENLDHSDEGLKQKEKTK